MVEPKTSRTKCVPDVRKYVVRAAVICCLMAVIAYWYQTGQMMLSAALPSMCACSMCLGFYIGEYVKGRE